MLAIGQSLLRNPIGLFLQPLHIHGAVRRSYHQPVSQRHTYTYAYMGERRTRSAIYPREIPPITVGNQETRTERRHSFCSLRASGSAPNQASSLNGQAARLAPGESKQELARRRRRQKKLKKLEQLQEKRERKTREIKTTPGRRIFHLPGRVRPISLFIRLGSLNSDQDIIPIEFFDLMSPDEESPECPDPHPAALAIRNIFHLDDRRSEEYEMGYGREGEQTPRENRTEGRMSVRRAHHLPRPSSVQFPLASALKKPAIEGTPKRPKSLRILDPRDMKLYEAVAHRMVPTDGTLDTNEEKLPQHMRRLVLEEGDRYPRSPTAPHQRELAMNGIAASGMRGSTKSLPGPHPNVEDEAFLTQ